VHSRLAPCSGRRVSLKRAPFA